MAEDFYIGVDGQARRVVSAYVGVDGVAREITGGYVGIDGVANPFFSGGKIEFINSRLDIRNVGGKQGDIHRISLALNDHLICFDPDSAYYATSGNIIAYTKDFMMISDIAATTGSILESSYGANRRNYGKFGNESVYRLCRSNSWSSARIEAWDDNLLRTYTSLSRELYNATSIVHHGTCYIGFGTKSFYISSSADISRFYNDIQTITSDLIFGETLKTEYSTIRRTLVPCVSTNIYAMFIGGHTDSTRTNSTAAKLFSCIDTNGVLTESNDLPIYMYKTNMNYANTVDGTNVAAKGYTEYLTIDSNLNMVNYSSDEYTEAGLASFVATPGNGTVFTGKKTYQVRLSSQYSSSGGLKCCSSDLVIKDETSKVVNLTDSTAPWFIQSDENLLATYYWQKTAYALIAEERDDGDYQSPYFKVIKIPK